MHIIINLMKIVPKNLISFFLGCFVRIRFPKPIQNFLNSAFVKLFGINIKEAEKSLDLYETIEEVFTRKIQPDARTMQGTIVSPSDGTLCVSLPTERDRAIQAKGLSYSLEELVFGMQGCGNHSFEPGWYTTVYLAPHNYHRVHTPISGKLKSIRYIPGELWPVNLPFVKNLPYLFTRNERLVFEILHESGGSVYIVMVGALNVGRIESLHFPELTTNSFSRQFGASHMYKEFQVQDGNALNVGDELGVFMLGSTAICVFDKKVLADNNFEKVDFTERKVTLGDSLLN